MTRDCSIIVNARDLFSSTGPMLANLRANIPADVPIIAVIGGASEHLRSAWQRQHGDRVEFIFEDHFINQAEARNIGLRRCETPWAVVIDNDNFVRPGWLEALLTCRDETGAMVVAPLLLERPRRIHCAGCDLYITTDAGKQYGHKWLRYQGLPYADGANIARAEIDYAELHTMLVQVAPTLEHSAMDEKILEVGEVDSGLTWRRLAKGSIWCEPRAVVHYVEDAPIRAEDIRLFAWRWEMRAVLQGYRHFEAKWGFDITEHGTFRDFLFFRNDRVGPLARALPSRMTLALEHAVARNASALRRLLRGPETLLRIARRRALGYHAWPTFESSLRNRVAGHSDLA